MQMIRAQGCVPILDFGLSGEAQRNWPVAIDHPSTLL